MMSITPQDITGLILAGSQEELGLQDSEVLPRVLQTLMRLSPQVGVLRLHATGHVARYASMGVPVWTESAEGSDQAGWGSRVPGLSDVCKGIYTGLSRCTTPYLLTVSGDVPRFPLDIVLRLSRILSNERLDIVLATRSGAPSRSLGLSGICLMRTAVRHSLQACLQTSSHPVEDWLAQQRSECVDWLTEPLREPSRLAGLPRRESRVIA